MFTPAFKLSAYGRPDDMRASLSHMSRQPGSQALVDEINAQLETLPRCGTEREAIAQALPVLKRYGFGAHDPRGWFEDPRK